jgi:hypothetical protein
VNTFITALTSELTSANLWGELAAAGAFLGLMVVFAFGYRIVRRLVNGVSKGKAKI